MVTTVTCNKHVIDYTAISQQWAMSFTPNFCLFLKAYFYII